MMNLLLQGITGQLFTGGGGGCAPIVGTTWNSTVGTTNNDFVPFYGLYDYSQSMTIYRQSDIGAGEKQINSIAFQLKGFSSGYTVNDQRIKLAHITDSQFGTNVKSDLTGIAGLADLTECKVQNVTVVNGWITFTFDTNFCYNGVDNLMIVWENRDGTWASGYGWAETHSTSSQFLTWYVYQDNTYPASVYGTRSSVGRMNIRIGY
jgi:hypothetical protein